MKKNSFCFLLLVFVIVIIIKKTKQILKKPFKIIVYKLSIFF